MPSLGRNLISLERAKKLGYHIYMIVVWFMISSGLSVIMVMFMSKVERFMLKGRHVETSSST